MTPAATTESRNDLHSMKLPIDDMVSFFFFQAEDGIRDVAVTGVQTCALPISQRGALYDKHAERNADENGDEHGDDHERKVVECGADNFVAMIDEERPGGLRIQDRKSVV